MKILGILAGAALLVGAQSAYAVTITNGSFEAPIVGGNYSTYGPGAEGTTPLTGWGIDGAGIDHIGSYWNAQSGNQSVDLNGPGIGGIFQTITGLNNGQEYTVSFYVAATPGYGPQDINVSFGSTNQLVSLGDTGSNSNMNWAVQTIKFIADATGTALLKFAGTGNLINNAAGMALDNVTIAATPIPPAILLFASALGGMGLLGYRRKKQAAEA
jgi:choice-of-anchor C domain-containing protein